VYSEDYLFSRSEVLDAYKLIYDVDTCEFVGSEDIDKMLLQWNSFRKAPSIDYLDYVHNSTRQRDLESFLSYNQIDVKTVEKIQSAFKCVATGQTESVMSQIVKALVSL